jgi:hypothetical protein
LLAGDPGLVTSSALAFAVNNPNPVPAISLNPIAV